MIITENYNIFFKSILYNYFENEDFRKSCIDIINNEIEDYSLIQEEEQIGDNILKLNYIEDFEENDFEELKDKKYEDLEELHLPFNFNIKIKKNSLPKKLKYLNLGFKYNHKFEEGDLPDSIEKLELSDNYNFELEKNTLPKNLKELYFGSSYNFKLTNNTFPENLEKIEFISESEFNQKIEKDVLPENLKVLKLGRLFNQKLEKDVLPNNLKKLYLSDNYNYELQKGDLPDELEILHIGRYYNKNIDFDNLPTKLKRLVFLNNNYMGKIIINNNKELKELKDLIITHSIFDNGDIKDNIHHFEFVNIINSEFFYLNNKRYIKEYKTDDLIFIKYYIQNIFRTKYKKRKYEDELKLKIIEPKNIKKYLDYGYELDDIFEVLNLISE